MPLTRLPWSRRKGFEARGRSRQQRVPLAVLPRAATQHGCYEC